MIVEVPDNFVPGDVIAYIPRVEGGVHPVVLFDNVLHICNNRFREKSIVSFELPFEPGSWGFFGKTQNSDDRYLPLTPIVNPFGYGVFMLTLLSDNENWLIGLKFPSSNNLKLKHDQIEIGRKFLMKTKGNDIIGITPSSKPTCPDITLADEFNNTVYHHSAEDGRLLSEQTFRRRTIFPAYARVSTKQLAYDGEKFLAFTTDVGKYEFLWPIELSSSSADGADWMLEWDERAGYANLFDGSYYNVIDLSKKEIVVREQINKLGFGQNSTIYESEVDGLNWIRRFVKDGKKAITVHKILDGGLEAIDFIRSQKLGDLYLYGQDTEDKFSVILLIPDPQKNTVKVLEFKDLKDSVYYSELDEQSGELHLFSDKRHYKTAPLQDLLYAV